MPHPERAPTSPAQPPSWPSAEVEMNLNLPVRVPIKPLMWCAQTANRIKQAVKGPRPIEDTLAVALAPLVWAATVLHGRPQGKRPEGELLSLVLARLYPILPARGRRHLRLLVAAAMPEPNRRDRPLVLSELTREGLAVALDIAGRIPVPEAESRMSRLLLTLDASHNPEHEATGRARSPLSDLRVRLVRALGRLGEPRLAPLFLQLVAGNATQADPVRRAVADQASWALCCSPRESTLASLMRWLQVNPQLAERLLGGEVQDERIAAIASALGRYLPADGPCLLRTLRAGRAGPC